VWKHVKHDRIGRAGVTSPDDLKAKALAALHRLQKLPHLVQGFFQDPNLRYITARTVHLLTIALVTAYQRLLEDLPPTRMNRRLPGTGAVASSRPVRGERRQYLRRGRQPRKCRTARAGRTRKVLARHSRPGRWSWCAPSGSHLLGAVRTKGRGERAGSSRPQGVTQGSGVLSL
jgi:hypothetical protein